MDEVGAMSAKRFAGQLCVTAQIDSADFELPLETIEAIEPQVSDVLRILIKEFDEEIEDFVGDMQPCEHCRNQKYETYYLLTILRRAFVQSYFQSQSEPL